MINEGLVKAGENWYLFARFLPSLRCTLYITLKLKIMT